MFINQINVKEPAVCHDPSTSHIIKSLDPLTLLVTKGHVWKLMLSHQKLDADTRRNKSSYMSISEILKTEVETIKFKLHYGSTCVKRSKQ